MIAAIALMAAGTAGATDQRVAEPTDLVFARADEEAALKSEAFLRVLGDEESEFDVDLEQA